MVEKRNKPYITGCVHAGGCYLAGGCFLPCYGNQLVLLYGRHIIQILYSSFSSVFFAHFYFPDSGQAVVTGVVPFHSLRTTFFFLHNGSN